MFHADSYLEPLVEDMVDIHITTWQGALRTNNFKAIQERVKGKLICMGGIDSIVDHKGWTEEEVRAEVRRAIAEYAPYGAYIPCITYGCQSPFSRACWSALWMR